jgi:aromatic ring-opening dioxygenase LigB subunit
VGCPRREETTVPSRAAAARAGGGAPQLREEAPPVPNVCGAIAPHGGLVVPELASDPAQGAATRAAMVELGRRFRAAAPEVIFLITPHGIRIEGAFAVSGGWTARGELGPLRQEFVVDRELAAAIVATCRAHGVPAALVSTGGSSGPAATVPLDWGATVPLYFMGADWQPRPKVVIAGPTRALSLAEHVAFGRAVAEAAAGSGKRVGYIASSDLAHAHDPAGPYGYDPAAAAFDAWLRDAVVADDLLRLLQADMAQVERAKPDGLWQILTLAGARQVTPMRGEFLSYEVPTYFGMLCAAYAGGDAL